jgi:ADP-ribosylation factor GTPase-activating protein 2/3
VPAPTAVAASAANLSARKGVAGGKPKLGAKKALGAAVTGVSFEEAMKQAQEEEEARERAKLTGMPATAANGATDPASVALSGRLAYQDDGASSGGRGGAAPMSQEKAANLERLGMGMGRLGFGADGSSARCGPQHSSFRDRARMANQSDGGCTGRRVGLGPRPPHRPSSSQQRQRPHERPTRHQVRQALVPALLHMCMRMRVY